MPISFGRSNRKKEVNEMEFKETIVENASLLVIAILGTVFGVFALYMGIDGTVLNAVFVLLGTVAGYLAGKKAAE